jgi:ABC-type cobalamin/Fe3+-siderophores transport system ATPase subunit
MSLLSIKHVTTRHGRGRIERLVLKDVSMDVEAGELIAVWGLRRSGRTTLLRIATGMERPNQGTVLFAGQELARCRDKILGSEIGCVQLPSSLGGGESVLDWVAEGWMAGGISLAAARRRARETLAEVKAEGCAEFSLRELDAGEAVRAALARALTGGPRLLVVDEPTNGVDLMDRDPILRLLRGTANRGVAVLMTTGDGAALAGVDRSFTLDHGELLGGDAQRLASVSPLRRRASHSAQSGRMG